MVRLSSWHSSFDCPNVAKHVAKRAIVISSDENDDDAVTSQATAPANPAQKKGRKRESLCL